jgi:hypothetical protein
VNRNPLVTAGAGGRSRRLGRRSAPHFTDALLIGSSVALALWLGAVAAHLALPPDDCGELARQTPWTVVDAPTSCHCAFRDAAVPRSSPRGRQGEEADSEQFARRRTTNREEPSGSTEFERPFGGQVPIGARQDRRTFLQVASIQIHAPASAFPRPASMSSETRFGASHPHGVD